MKILEMIRWKSLYYNFLFHVQLPTWFYSLIIFIILFFCNGVVSFIVLIGSTWFYYCRRLLVLQCIFINVKSEWVSTNYATERERETKEPEIATKRERTRCYGGLPSRRTGHAGAAGVAVGSGRTQVGRRLQNCSELSSKRWWSYGVSWVLYKARENSETASVH